MSRTLTSLSILGKLLAASLAVAVAANGATAVLPGTTPLSGETDLSAAMVAGLHRHLDALTQEVSARRAADWDRRANTPTRAELLQRTRSELARMIGAAGPRASNPRFELIATPEFDGRVAETTAFRVQAVRWPVFGGFHAEGLLLQPRGPARALVVALPDADQTPELITGVAPGLPAERQYARRLAESG